MTDTEFIQNISAIADEYIDDTDEYAYTYMERIIDLLSDYNEGR